MIYVSFSGIIDMYLIYKPCELRIEILDPKCGLISI